jgi:soluble lytic murein transglycosylase-like protein
MAIDWRRWRHRLDDPDPAALLEPAANLRLGAAIVADSLRATPDDPALAVGHVAYPADATAARAFGRRVLRIATALGLADPAGAPKRRLSGTHGSPGEALARPLIEAAARRHGLDPAFALAVAHTESRFDQAARSPQGARGVMQLMPATAARYGARAGELAENIDAGVRYLRDLAERFDGDPTLVAAAYNAGEGAVLRYRRQVPPFPETQRYVPRVMAAREAYGCTINQ